MPVRFSAIVPLSMTALLVGGCISMPFGGDDKPAQPAPLPAAPTGPVTQAPLPPPPATPPTDPNAPPSGLAALDPASQGATPAAAPPPPPPADVEVGRADLLGGWTIASAGDSCQLFMTLTTWSGGYRATTKGCSNATLQQVSAWNMDGKQVQLLSDSGATVARLYPSSKTQFNGQSEGGGPVSVSR
jgi:protease inhibitor Inh